MIDDKVVGNGSDRRHVGFWQPAARSSLFLGESFEWLRKAKGAPRLNPNDLVYVGLRDVDDVGARTTAPMQQHGTD